jgi:hypothetical protein
LGNTKISIFGGISKFHLWANFGNFEQIWAEFPALAMADCMPQTLAEIFKTSKLLNRESKKDVQ